MTETVIDAQDPRPRDGGSGGRQSAARAPTVRPAVAARDLPLRDANKPFDLDAPALYLNRELTWLTFNRRVLHEAQDPRTPLLERVKFLAIVSGNLDEFFMKRVGGLRQLLAAGQDAPSVDGRTPAEQLRECRTEVLSIQRHREAIVNQVLKELREHSIGILRWKELDHAQRHALRDEYRENVLPLVTPLAMDPSHPFPFISNLALNLLVTMRFPGDNELRMARVKVPSIKDVAPRLVRIGDSNYFVLLEDLMAHNLDLLFPGMKIESCEVFRVTRNARVELEQDEADDLLQLIKYELRERHFSPIVRLQAGAGMVPSHLGMLTAELGLGPEDVFEIDGMMAMHDLFEIAELKLQDLREAPHHPVEHPRLATDARKIFYIIRDGGPLLLQHPYESFQSSVERFLRTAARDPKVLAIKMTLYRTSAEGSIIQSLIDAARNGKQVAVLVELKARFDEAANIRWARRLEEVGIHVTYGVLGLKTHCKLTLVVRRDFDRLRRYAHIGTGNYHAGTALHYSDVGMLTCDPDIGADISEVFNYLTGFSAPQAHRKMLAAPHTLKQSLLKKIEREIEAHSEESPGLIQFKCNALEDYEITQALYRAGVAGVQVDLIVRDTCRLRPGVPGLSENIRVLSIVGRFLEHARIFYFRNGGDEEYYIGSADLMTRNLEQRVEVLAPVEDVELREDLRLIFNVQLSDRRSAWDMHADGSYTQRTPEAGQDDHGSHEALTRIAEKRFAAAEKRQRKKVRKRLSKDFRRRVERK